MQRIKMILIDYISPVAKLLAGAAKTNTTVSFNNFHNVFPNTVADSDKYDTLEAASITLCHPITAIYSALLSKKQTNCPGMGFYDIFKNIRPADYQQLANQTLVQDLTSQQQLAIATNERNRIYQHAQTNAYL
jgi:hypothetical protein